MSSTSPKFLQSLRNTTNPLLNAGSFGQRSKMIDVQARSSVGATPLVHRPRTLPTLSMENKVCVVTGAARGLGFEFCKAFVESGCTSVALLDLRDTDTTQAADELRTFYEETSDADKGEFDVLPLACDVSDEASVANTFKAIIERFGRVDVVVASAGIVENYSALEYPTERIKRLFEINVYGSLFTAREAAKYMIPNGSGSIVMVASMSASVVNLPQPQAPYNASKAAVRQLANSLAVEWAKTGVRVNTLSPGYMLTKLTRTVLAGNPEQKKIWEELTPMGKMGEPEDLKGAVVFLSSDASKFMTGSEIRVDGGYCTV